VPQPPAAQHPAALRIAVSFIQRHLVRPLAGPTPTAGHSNTVEHRLQLGAFVPLSRRQADRERPTAPVGGEVQLGAEPAATAPQRLVGCRRRPLFPLAPPSRPAPGSAGPPPRVGARGRSCRPPRPPSRPPPPRRPPRLAGPGVLAPRPLGAASGAADRGRSSISHSAPAGHARERRCARPRESR
jgi:hypothetical protein